MIRDMTIEVRRLHDLKYSKPLDKWLVWYVSTKGKRDFQDFPNKIEALEFWKNVNETHPFKEKEKKKKQKKLEEEEFKRNIFVKKKNHKRTLKNITINIPKIYDENIQKLIKSKRFPSRSETIRTALREFLFSEYSNLELLGFFKREPKGEKK